jgi:predicted DNA-binding transcriptional regulator YafY
MKLLALLQMRRFWSGADLAGQLQVTERTLRRDVDRLRSLGYVIRTTPGVGGGYQLGPGKDLPPLPLDDDEAVAVAVGLRALSSGASPGGRRARCGRW